MTRHPHDTRPRRAIGTGALLSLLAVTVTSDAVVAGTDVLVAGAARDEIVVPFGPSPIWLAGRGGHRPATFQHDTLEAQALYVEQGETNLALVGVDLIGLHHNFVDGLRERLRGEQVVDHLFVFATHTHSAPDTIGAWGPDSKTSGILEPFLDEVAESILHVVHEARRLRAPARLSLARERTGAEGLLDRTRPPRVVDDMLSALFVDREGSGERIATLVNYSAHPESLAPPREENDVLRHAVSSDYVHYLRESLGSAPVLFANGAVATVNPYPFLDRPPDGQPVADGAAWARRFGQEIAGRIAALEHGRRVLMVEAIDVRTEHLRLPVVNTGFLYGYCFGLFGDRPFYRSNTSEPLAREEACDLPQGVELETEVSLIDMGEARLLALPGEIFPEFLVGYGEDGSAGTADVFDDDCAPRLEDAPRGPYLREMLERGGRGLFVLGLTNDEIGYIVPDYDFVLDAERPYLRKPTCGSHYHETNSLGPQTGSLLLQAIGRLDAPQKNSARRWSRRAGSNP